MSKWRYRRIGFAVTAAAILAIMMITTRLQIRCWSNSVTLFEHALEVTVGNSIVHTNLGEALAGQGKIDAAVRHYHEALRIKPDFVEPLLNLGIASKEKGELNEAINHFSKALRIKPDRAKVYNNLGIVLALQNKDKEAINSFYEALRIDPAYAGAYYNLGKVFANQGKTKEAILNYRKALSFSPYMSGVIYNLSWILACSVDEKYRNGTEAVQLAEKLCEITNYEQSLALDALAAAYAETGRFEEAVLTAQKALKLALLYGPEELALGLQKRLELYQAKRPFRQILSHKNEL
jgi:tetratricopeptide (TPR) repeat protein